MNTNKRVNRHQNCGDQELVDLYRRLKDRSAIAELYERYRVSLGHYLYRDIKSKTTVVNTFNSIMLNLVTKPSHRSGSGKVSTKLFAMAYTCRNEYLAKESRNRAPQASSTKTREQNTFESKLARLPRQHADVAELIYRYNFTFDEAADIMDCPGSVIRNCLSHIKSQYRLLIEDSSSSRTGT